MNLSADILVSSWGIKDTAAFGFTTKFQHCFRIGGGGGGGGILLVWLQKLQNPVNMKRMTQSAQSLVGSAFH